MTRNEAHAKPAQAQEAADGAPAQGTGAPGREDLYTNDPERIQALAHPLRLKLIDLVQNAGEMTASEAAEQLGQTVANCSFHLRVLEKAGFVERAEPRGREKPWRISSRRRTLDPDPESRASVLALAELVTASLTLVEERFGEYMREHFPVDEPRWRETAILDQMSLWATPEELAQIRDTLVGLTRPLLERRFDPDLRPDGARMVRMTVLVHPDPPQTSQTSE